MKSLIAAKMIAAACLLAVCAASGAASYQAAPYAPGQKNVPALEERFPKVNPEAYRVPVYKGQPARDISDPRHGFRTYLRRALKAGANFGGHYVLAMPGCGTACLNPIVVDVKTGKVYDVDVAPFTMFMGGPPDSPAPSDMEIRFSKESTLLLFAGSLGEYGTGSFALNFKDGRFHIVGYSKTVKYSVE